jgi:hypothetical protein
MAYRDAVVYIEQMKPDKMELVGRECLDAAGIIKSVLPSLTGIPAKMQWDSDAREAVDRASPSWSPWPRRCITPSTRQDRPSWSTPTRKPRPKWLSGKGSPPRRGSRN